MNNMNILVCSDKNYIMPTAVLIKSVAVNSATDFGNNYNSITVYILNSDLTDSDIREISSRVNESYVNIISLKVNADEFKELKVSGHISVATYYRMVASEILPKDVDRILYLDCDIIVNKSLHKLYNEDFNGSYLIACEDEVVSHKDVEVYSNLSFPLSETYFNAGVILFNIEEMRKIDGLKVKLFDFISDHDGKLKYHDQDILNGFFNGKVKFTSPFLYNNLVKWIKNKKALKESYEKTVVFHYADKWKPWKHNYIGYADDLFWKYACMVGYNDLCKEYKRKHIVYKYIPFNVLRKIKRCIF